MKNEGYYLTRFDKPESAFELRGMNMPEPGAGEIRIRVTAFGLNFADIMARQGLYRGCPPLPCVLGYEVEGVVDAIGPDVSKFRIGDSVFALTRFGGYARYVVTPSVAADHLLQDAATGAGCSLAVHGVTAYHAAVQAQTLMPGEKVVIHSAAGGLGTMLIQLAQWKGCTVIGIVGGEKKVNFLKSIGADHIIDHHKGDPNRYIQDHLGKVDVIFDNVGGKSVKGGRKNLAAGGRLVLLGAAALSGKKGKLNLLRLVLGFGWFSPIPFLGKSQSLIGVNMLPLADKKQYIIEYEMRMVAELAKEGILRPHLDKVFPHTALAEAHAYMEGRKTMGKVAVAW